MKNVVESLSKDEDIAFWLQNEFYYLKEEDKNILISKDAWLNDNIMNAPKKLICKALGKIDRFQSVLNSQKKTNYPFRAVSNEHIQLLHEGNQHWLLSFCSCDRVQICDSLKNKAGRYTLGSLNALYRKFKDTSTGKLTMSFLPVQKQEDGFNCGVFAIAYAAKFWMGNRPLKLDLMCSR